jgi:inner membrane protein
MTFRTSSLYNGKTIAARVMNCLDGAALLWQPAREEAVQMASAKQHLLIGAGVATIGWLTYCKLSQRPLVLGEFLLAAGIGAVGGLIPDLLEPAVDPNHRRFFHSYVAAVFLAQANHHVSRNMQIPEEIRGAIHLASLGFLSHLFADAQTPKSLPWV